MCDINAWQQSSYSHTKAFKVTQIVNGFFSREGQGTRDQRTEPNWPLYRLQFQHIIHSLNIRNYVVVEQRDIIKANIISLFQMMHLIPTVSNE